MFCQIFFISGVLVSGAWPLSERALFQYVNGRKAGERFVIRIVAENVRVFVGFTRAASFIFYCIFFVETSGGDKQSAKIVGGASRYIMTSFSFVCICENDMFDAASCTSLPLHGTQRVGHDSK